MKLVDDVNKAHTWLSMHVALVTTILGAAYANINYIRSQVSPAMFGWVTFALGILYAVARVIKQTKDAAPTGEQP